MSLRKDKDYLFNDIILYPKIKPKKIENNSFNVEFKCCICYESSKNIKFINCVKGCIQSTLPPKGKTYNCCHDKPICYDCIDKCHNECPFCKNHKLCYIKRFPKKKLPFAEREIKRLKKLRKKIKKSKKNNYQVRPDANQSYIYMDEPILESAWVNILQTFARRPIVFPRLVSSIRIRRPPPIVFP